jgi:Domain of unknown function (DUF4424)
MKLSHAVPVLAFAAFAGGAFANDTTAQLGTGGLIFVKNWDVNMLSEDLFVSQDEVKVKYEFRNDNKEDQHVLVAFPMPDIEGSGDFMVGIPTEDPDNIFGFTTTFNGEPVDATLHQYAFSAGIDQSEYLRGLGVPLTPYGDTTQTAINALSDDDHNKMEELGLVFPMEYDAGSGQKTDYVPIWTLRSTYSWEATFPAGKTVEVEHSYKPSVGGTVAVTFLSPPYDDYDPATTYKKKYCTDDALINAVKKTLPDPNEPYGAPYYESWISYVWSTGANWSGTIGKFTLTIDKGDPENMVSFCWDGPVKKISPTQFQMTATDWYPPYDKELEILILDKQEAVQ